MTFEGMIRPRHNPALATFITLLLLSTSCGSDSIDDSGIETTTTEVAPTTSLPPATTTPTTDPPAAASNTSVVTAISNPINPEAGSEFCLAYYQLEALSEQLVEPDTDPESAWDAMVLAVAKMSEFSPPGYEDELSRTSDTIVEYRATLARHDYDLEAAGDELELITAEYDQAQTSGPEVDDYLDEVCTGELADYENALSGDADSE